MYAHRGPAADTFPLRWKPSPEPSHRGRLIRRTCSAGWDPGCLQIVCVARWGACSSNAVVHWVSLFPDSIRSRLQRFNARLNGSRRHIEVQFHMGRVREEVMCAPSAEHMDETSRCGQTGKNNPLPWGDRLDI
jgi:hypothetical protein